MYTKSCAQTCPPVFGLFAIFDCIFAKIVALSSDENESYVVHLKEQSLLKKRTKPRRNRPINGNAMLVQTMHPRTHNAPDSEREHIFAPTAGARSSISPKLCMVIEDVAAIKKGVNHSFQRIVFPTRCTEKFGVNDRRVVSQQ